MGAFAGHPQRDRIHQMVLDGASAQEIAGRCGVTATAVNDYIAGVVYGAEVKTTRGALVDDPPPAPARQPARSAMEKRRTPPASPARAAEGPAQGKGASMSTTAATAALDDRRANAHRELRAIEAAERVQEAEREAALLRHRAQTAELDRLEEEARRRAEAEARERRAALGALEQEIERTEAFVAQTNAAIAEDDRRSGAAAERYRRDLDRTDAFLAGLHRQEDAETLRRAQEADRWRRDHPFDPLTARRRQSHPDGCGCRECGLLYGRVSPGDPEE